MRFTKKAVPPLVAAVVAALAFGAVSAHASGSKWDPPNEPVEAFSSNTQLEYGGSTVSCNDAHAEGNTGTGDPGFLDFVSFGNDHAGGGCTSSVFGSSIRSIVVDMGNDDWPLEAVDHTSNPQVARVIMDQRASVVVTVNVLFSPQCTITVDGRKQNQERGPIYADFHPRAGNNQEQLRFGRARNPQDLDNVWVESTCPGHDPKGWGTWSGIYERTNQNDPGNSPITMVAR